MIWLSFVALLFSVAGSGQDHSRRTHAQMERLHANPEAYISMLEDSGRDGYQKPEEVIAALGIQPGDVVVDIGAGSGYFTFRLAKAVGEGGRVYGVDINPAMILHMNRRIRDSAHRNVTTVLADPQDPLIPAATADFIFICNTWHHIEERSDYLSHLKRSLSPGGKVVMVDFKKEPLPVGPGVEEKISRDDLIAEMAEGGFQVTHEFEFLPYQYFLVFSISD